MRAISLWAAAAAIALCARPAAAATYATDKSYQFAGQTNFNTGDGLAVNPADTRLYTVVSSATAGSISILDLDTRNAVGSITPPSPTLIRDIAISPDGGTIYYIRDTDTASSLEYAPASDGTHGPNEVVAIDGGPTQANPSAVPLTNARSLAVLASGGDLYIGVASNANFYIYKKSAGGGWTQETAVPLSVSSARRDVTAAQAAAGPTFFVLTPGGASAPNVQAFDLAGASRPITFAAPPSGFQGYYWDSLTSAGDVDGQASLFLVGDTVDDDYNARISAFRYATDGTYTGDGFGYGLSAGALNALGPVGSSTVIAPGAAAGSHFYLDATYPDRFGGGPQTVQVTITSGTAGPGSIAGVVNAGGQGASGAQVVIAGRDAPTATTDATGAFSLSPLNQGAYTIGASRFGYVAASTDVSLAAGETKTGVALTLPGPVPTFTLGSVFAPPITDGQIFPGEYNSPGMPLYTLGGSDPVPELAGTAWVTHDDENLYVAVQAGEPSLALNSAAWSNQNMLTLDDSVQIYVDPPHRHDAPGGQPNLFQFAANIPAIVGGIPNGAPQRIQRILHPDGSLARTLDGIYWFARAGYTDTGWMLEARISLDAFQPFAAPDGNAVWGLLIGRNRPDAHRDNLPNLYSTSPVQAGRLTAPNTWTDVMFGQPVTGVKGDVDQNGRVDMTDALYALRMAGGLSFGTPVAGDPYPSDPNVAIRQGIYARGNVWPPAKDTHITLEDALVLLRAATGIAPL